MSAEVISTDLPTRGESIEGTVQLGERATEIRSEPLIETRLPRSVDPALFSCDHRAVWNGDSKDTHIRTIMLLEGSCDHDGDELSI